MNKLPSIFLPCLQHITSYSFFKFIDHSKDLLDDLDKFLDKLLVIELIIGLLRVNPLGNSDKL